MSVKALIRQAKKKASDGDSCDVPASVLAQGTPSKPKVAQLPLPAALPVLGSEHLVGQLPSVWLLEEWLPPEVEAQLLTNLRSCSQDFIQLRGKRTARYGGDPGPPFRPEPLPEWLCPLCEAVAAAGPEGATATPNHVLVNHYRAGEGIMPHTDGPAYEPRAAIVSLGSAAVFEFWRDHAHAAQEEAPPTLSLLLPPRSLLLFTGEAYSGQLHGIRDRLYDDVAGVANGLRGIDGFEWARRQLSSVGGSHATGEENVQMRVDNTRQSELRRDERFSLTIRRVVPPLEVADTGREVS